MRTSLVVKARRMRRRVFRTVSLHYRSARECLRCCFTVYSCCRYTYRRASRVLFFKEYDVAFSGISAAFPMALSALAYWPRACKVLRVRIRAVFTIILVHKCSSALGALSELCMYTMVPQINALLKVIAVRACARFRSFVGGSLRCAMDQTLTTYHATSHSARNLSL